MDTKTDYPEFSDSTSSDIGKIEFQKADEFLDLNSEKEEKVTKVISEGEYQKIAKKTDEKGEIKINISEAYEREVRRRINHHLKD